MPGTVVQSDFTAGELSPSLLARVDLAKYGKGARTMRNFFVQSHGPAAKRPGFEFLGTLPGPAVLLEFAFNSEQAYALILGEKWLRVATHDGLVLDGGGSAYAIETPYTLEQARRISYTQSADVLFLACQGVAPHKLMRLGHANWKFEAMTFGAPLKAPSWRDVSGTKYSYSEAYGPGEAYSYDELVGYAPIDMQLYSRKGTDYYYPNIHFVNGARDSLGDVSPAQLVTPYAYHVTVINKAGKESELSLPAKITGPSSNNWQGGDYIVMSWAAVAGADEYRVYKGEFGGRPAYVATVKDLEYKDFNVAPSVSEGAPEYVDPFPNGDFPGTVCIFQQRLVFASSPKRPQTIWTSKTGDYTNFATYIPKTDDAPIEMTIASREVSPINWMVQLRSLILGTPSIEWEITGRGDAAFSAKNSKAEIQSCWGSSLTRAMIVGNIVLHVSSSGRQVRSLQYEFGSDSYGGSDLSIMAAHLLEEHRIIDWAYQKNPDSTIWAVRSDGGLLGLTFQAEHQIAAWHRHDTQGKFKAVCAIPHGAEHSVFAIIERDGNFLLERMAPYCVDEHVSVPVFLDSSLTYTGEEVQALSGLDHLEGKEVGILSQGAIEPPRKVKDGKITLDAPTKQVTVGLLYTAELETMPVEVVGQGGTSVGMKKQISTTNITFHKSLGVEVGYSVIPGQLQGIKWESVKWRTNEPYGSAPKPFSGIKHVTLPSLAENTVSVCIRSTLPTPVTVQSIMSRVDVKG